MSQKNRRNEPQIPARKRVGTFHFAPLGTRQFRLVAVLYTGEQRQIHTAPTIGDLWRRAWLVETELESDVVQLRVEVTADRNGKPVWKPLLETGSSRRDNQD